MSATLPEVMRALRARYPKPRYALLEQVAQSTGAVRPKRFADAVAMSLYPSRGLHLHGLEVKLHRSDWIRELMSRPRFQYQVL